METISLKLTSAQARMIEKAARDSAFPSKSEFVRYAIARALEDKLSVGTIEEIFEARRQVRAGKTTPLAAFKRDG
jgi:Arc/MetJ-type ribon-helix-helix transcriptional regulator